MLDEDHAVEVGDGDVVAVNDDRDLLEATPSADRVGDVGLGEAAGGAQLLDGGAGGWVRPAAQAGSVWRPP